MLFKSWVLGLLAALLSGIFDGITIYLMGSALKPEFLNDPAFLKIFLVSVLLNMAKSGGAYLKQSPVPKE